MKHSLVRLGDICTVVSGSTPKSGISDYWDGDVVWITPAELTEDSYIINDSVRHITQKAVQETSLKPFPAGTVILSSRAPIGKTAIAGREMYCNQGFKNLICSSRVNNKYLYFFLSCKTEYLNSLGRGATFKEISKTIVENIEIPLPGIPEQKRIATEFEHIQGLEQGFQKQVSFFDQLVKSQFVEMFGDPEINPCNWPVVPLANVISKANNGMARRGNDTDGEIVLRLIELQDGYIDYTTPNRIILNDMEKRRYLLKDKDFLFARVNGNPKNVGRCAVFHDIGEPVYHNDHIIRVRFDDDSLDGIFASVLLNSAYGKRQIRGQIKTSAGQYTISQDGIGAILAITPPLALQTRFAAFVAQVDKSKVEIQKAIDQLEILKKSLMQQYFG